MKLLAKLGVIAMAAAIAVSGASYASTKTAKTTSKMTTKAPTKSVKPTCKGATVYAVAASKIYYVKGASMYGHAKGGSYMCMAAANGQGFKKSP